MRGTESSGVVRGISCGEPATQRCSRCKLEWYCSRKCQVTSPPQHHAPRHVTPCRHGTQKDT
eukprot:535447-Rhodomonas_salina.3